MGEQTRLPQLDGVRFLAQLWILCAENLFLGYKVRCMRLHCARYLPGSAPLTRGSGSFCPKSKNDPQPQTLTDAD